MIRKLLDVEGPVIGFLDKAGQLIALSVLWLLGCVPIVTVGTSCAALYYAVIKSVRRGQGSAVKEFFRCYRENLARGIAVTVLSAGAAALLVLCADRGNSLLSATAVLGALVLGFMWVYFGPILSRFRIPLDRVWKLTFVMALRFAHFAAPVLCGTVVLAALQIFVLPVPAALILPGAWCYVTTFPIEKALLGFMPGKKENDNAWYYET